MDRALMHILITAFSVAAALYLLGMIGADLARHSFG